MKATFSADMTFEILGGQIPGTGRRADRVPAHGPALSVAASAAPVHPTNGLTIAEPLSKRKTPSPAVAGQGVSYWWAILGSNQ
jgi:hypothetical protein